MIKKISILLINILFCSYSFSDISCSGYVQDVKKTSQGFLMVNIDTLGKENIICNLAFEYGGISTKSCKKIKSTLESAVLSNDKIQLKFQSNSKYNCEKNNLIDFSHYGIYEVDVE